MATLTDIKLEDYHFDLPSERIAQFPVTPRDSAKLLVCKEGQIAHKHFRDLTELLDDRYQLFFNNTKVLPARLFFRKESGALIEIFLFNPVSPTRDINQAMLVGNGTVWSTTIGNLKRWKDTPLRTSLHVNGLETIFEATLIDREQKLVQFTWDQPSLSFIDLVSAAGETPLPPYLKREAVQQDKETYQTVYSQKAGAVAAPTAGLHFTEELLATLEDQGVELHALTLHVSAGTFKPVTAEKLTEHDMHNEQIIVERAKIEALLKDDKKVVAVGTTSMRTLESLYWFGVRLIKDGEHTTFDIQKLEPYEQSTPLPSKAESMHAILAYMDKHGLEQLGGETSIFILPTYKFKIVDVLITNFHLPSTTLVLLVGAFIGDIWKDIYQQALDNDYRFLSYGDSSILFRPDKTS